MKVSTTVYQLAASLVVITFSVALYLILKRMGVSDQLASITVVAVVGVIAIGLLQYYMGSSGPHKAYLVAKS